MRPVRISQAGNTPAPVADSTALALVELAAYRRRSSSPTTWRQMQSVRTSRPCLRRALAGVLGQLLAGSPAMSRLSAVGPDVLPRWRGPDVGGPAPWRALDAGFAPRLVAVRWLGMVLADPWRC
jgi:hypothetical protein